MITFLLLFVGVYAQYGPGNGPWQTGTPEQFGLSTQALDAAEAATNQRINGRTCYLVIKNGVIVYEKYRGNGGVNVRRAAWSCTKSFCGSLFGIAVEQGWANVNDKIADKNSGTRQCNNNAEFRHALTMTGQSSNINNPRFSYDTLGTACLDSIDDFINQNNPDGLNTNNWKNRFWYDILGLESMTWSGVGNALGCGFGAETTCRDMARVAQLYLNDGAWPGAGQVMNQAYTRTSRTQVFNSGTNYGYTVWRQSNDPVDPDVSNFDGMYAQCAFMTKRHEALIISMGMDLSGGCSNAWVQSRNAIISKDVRHLYNTTLSPEELADEEELSRKNSHSEKEIKEMGDYMLSHPDDFSADDIRAYKEYLSKGSL